MLRIVGVMALLAATLLIMSLWAGGASDGSDDASRYHDETLYLGNPEAAMICETSVVITNDTGTERWAATILHPKGGSALIEESFQLLPEQPGVPDHLQVMETLGQYERAGTVCMSWVEMFQLMNLKTFGRASALLEVPSGVTTFDIRRALMKLWFKEQWEMAEAFFPLGEE